MRDFRSKQHMVIHLIGNGIEFGFFQHSFSGRYLLNCGSWMGFASNTTRLGLF
jgi:hypothetical protein